LATYPADVALLFVNLPLAQHAYAVPAAAAFLAAARQGQAWAMHDQMFAHQSALTDTDLDAYASAIGLDVARFDADRTGPEIADEVAQDEAFATSLGVNATPAFFVGGAWIVGAQPFSEFEKRIEKALAATPPDASAAEP
jgi:protein-disulfide isomerase